MFEYFQPLFSQFSQQFFVVRLFFGCDFLETSGSWIVGISNKYWVCDLTWLPTWIGINRQNRWGEYGSTPWLPRYGWIRTSLEVSFWWDDYDILWSEVSSKWYDWLWLLKPCIRSFFVHHSKKFGLKSEFDHFAAKKPMNLLHFLGHSSTGIFSDQRLWSLLWA